MTLLRISTRFKMAQSEDTLRSIDNTFIYNLETLCRAGKSENTLRSIHNIFIYNLEHFAELGLLSELYFYLWFPTSFGCGFCLYWLWIALSHLAFIFSGVRWFLIQNCIFTYDSQPNWKSKTIESCCELLSELYFYLWFPTTVNNMILYFSLWIAFRIVFLLMIPNRSTKLFNLVVLWIAFRIVFLLMIPNLILRR